jgi:hypothetical protein
MIANNAVFMLAKAKDEQINSFVFESVQFINQGQTRIVINRHIIIEPMSSFTISTKNGTIVEDFSIVFEPATTVPTIDNRNVNKGNKLLVIAVKPISQ